MIRDEINKLMNKPMDRKGFLQHIGATILIVTGITGLIAALTNPTGTERRGSAGYGGSRYGR
jgi:hypothetical protein